MMDDVWTVARIMFVNITHMFATNTIVVTENELYNILKHL